MVSWEEALYVLWLFWKSLDYFTFKQINELIISCTALLMKSQLNFPYAN